MSQSDLQKTIEELSSQVDLNHPAAAARLISLAYPSAKVRCLLRRRGRLSKLLSDTAIPSEISAAVGSLLGEAVTVQVENW